MGAAPHATARPGCRERPRRPHPHHPTPRRCLITPRSRLTEAGLRAVFAGRAEAARSVEQGPTRRPCDVAVPAAALPAVTDEAPRLP